MKRAKERCDMTAIDKGVVDLKVNGDGLVVLKLSPREPRHRVDEPGVDGMANMGEIEPGQTRAINHIISNPVEGSEG